MNISETGAAVRLDPLPHMAAACWAYYLSNGDNVWLSGLLDDPVGCWVIAVDQDVLRVRFDQDDVVRRQVRALIKQ